MKRMDILLSATLYILAVPAAQASSGWTLLQEELSAWEREEGVVLENREAEAADDAYQTSKELFPEIEKADERGALERQRDERTAAYVSIEMGEALVVFRDVPVQEWFAPFVRTIAEQRIVSGYRDEAGNLIGLFGPADHVTIAQLSKVFLLASRKDVSSCEGRPLNSTASGSWSASFVSCAEKFEWTIYGDGTVDVGRNATRAEVIMTMLQAFGRVPSERSGDVFTDVTLSTQFGAAIEQAKRDGVVSGYVDADGTPTGMFGPEAPVTRAELAKIVTFSMQVYAER